MAATSLHIGFTGTRRGMSPRQRHQFMVYMLALIRAHARTATIHFHHGDDREGADGEAATMIGRVLPADQIHAHPPEARTSDGFLKRNREIVAASDFLVLTPLENSEQVRSGTWATYRYACQKGIPALVLPR